MADQTNNLLIIPLTDDSAAGGQIGVPRTIKASTDTVKLGAPLELTNETAPLKVAGPLQSAAGTNLKLVGDDNIELKLGDDAGVAQFKVLDSQGVSKAYIDSDGHAQFDGSLTVDATAHFGGDVSIDGDLDVTGSIVARSQIDVLIHDSYLDLGFGNTTTAVQPGGFTVQMNRTSGFIAGKVTDFPSTTSFVYAQNDAANASLLVAGMVIAITGLPAEHAEDEGLFVVASVSGAAFPQTVTIESTPMVNLPWAQTLLTVGTPATAGSAYQTALAVVSVADGSNFKDAEDVAAPVGSLVTGYVSASTKAAWQANGAYVGVGAGSTTMQDTYENGNTITTDGNGNVVIGGSQALEVTASGGIVTNTLSASGDLSGANLTLSGDISADDAVFSGDVSGATAHFTGALEAASALLSGALDAASATLVGNLDAVDGVFSGNVSGVDGIFSGDISGADAALSGYVSAVGVTLSADLSGVNVVLSGNITAVDGVFSGDISSVDATLSGNLSAVQGIFSGDISGANANLSADLSAVNATLSADLSAVNGSFSADVDAVNAVLSGDLSAVNISISGDISGNDATFSGDLSAAAGDFTNGLTVSGAALNVDHSFDADLLGAFAVDGAQAITFGAATEVASFAVDAAGAISLDAGAASDFTVAGNLTLETTGAGITDLKSAAEVQVSTALFDVNASGAAEIDAAAASWFKVAGAQLELQTTGSGELDLTSAGLMDVNAGADLDIDATGNVTIDATGYVSIRPTGSFLVYGPDDNIGYIGIGATWAGTNGGTILIGGVDTAGNPSAINLTPGVHGLRINMGGGIGRDSGFTGISMGFCKNLAGVTVSRGQLLAQKVSPATDYARPQWTLASAHAASAASIRNVGGVCASTTTSSNNSTSMSVMSVAGCFCPVKFAVAPAGAADIGKPVYLSTASGLATLTAPSGSGETIYRVGFLARGVADALGLWSIQFMPQLIGLIP